MRFKSILFFLAIHCFSLFSYEFSHDGHNAHVEMHVNNQQQTQPSNNWHFSGRAIATPDYFAMRPANYSIIAHQASPELKSYFSKIVSPLIHDSAIKNHYVAIPGYVFADGLRGCINQLSQFSHSDAVLIADLTKRLEIYCTRIEDILFNDKNYEFCGSISHKDQIKLVHAYADFLKEFYAGAARCIFEKQSPNNPLMQQVTSSIKWGYYDARDVESNFKKIELRYAASVNGKLGAVYKALHEGDSKKAYITGHEQVKTMIPGRLFGKTVNTTSVFERYPALRQKVEQAYFADKAKAEQERTAKQITMQQDAAMMNVHYQDQSGEVLFQRHPDLLQDRYNGGMTQFYDPQFFRKIHNVLAEQVEHIDVQHLTPDQKGILFEGGHLQHHLIDEAISVVDVTISGDLVENIQDAVLDLANTSISLNKDGNVLMASRTLDACWALIDYAQDTARYTYATLSTHLPLVMKGACDGVCESLHSAVHAVCHPVEAAQDVAQSLATAGYYLGKVAYASCVLDAACDVLEFDPQHYEEIIAQYAIDPVALSAMYEHAKKNISSEDIARVGTKTILDMMLLHGATKAVSAIAQEYWAELISCMRKGEQSAEVALTAEKIPVQCGQEVASLMNNTEKVAGSATQSGLELEKNIFSTTEKVNYVEIKNPVLDNIRTGSGLKKDAYHAFDEIIDNYAGLAKEFDLIGRDRVVHKLYQLEGSLNGKEGLFEWIVSPDITKGVTHRLFIKDIKITGRPNAW